MRLVPGQAVEQALAETLVSAQLEQEELPRTYPVLFWDCTGVFIGESFGWYSQLGRWCFAPPPCQNSENSFWSNHPDKAAEFINQALEDGKRVLVHCHAGINRSVSSIVAYAALRAKAKASSTIAYVRRMNRDHRNLPAVSNPAFEQYLVRRWG